MTYYEEDQPPIESEKEHKLSPEEEFIKYVKNAVVEQPPMIMPVYKDAERHQELMEMLGGIFIQMSRLYDAVMLTLDDVDRERVESYHSQGKLLGDPPVLEEDAWS
jgi:hypothetical protein